MAKSLDDPSAIAAHFVKAFDVADRDRIVACLAKDLVAEITQPDGSTKQVHGRDGYMRSIDAMDIAIVRPSIKATQIAPVSSDQVMAMVEIRAKRKGRTLHNFAAFLMSVSKGQITRIWMVEALPAESDSFWKS
ncbi:nuclear transport factor 2 family protein [Ruegeria arenilitoris]|uniref:nuclear transport factor 2 family protein n=1 Tax=Ruegeria arenilitoris TaxID=1173585 RepID=UPI00147C9EB8|nr:nuclear transport factor 2 family protein [Ruegeria arenilitoris]